MGATGWSRVLKLEERGVDKSRGNLVRLGETAVYSSLR
jgi:hypothetical protein